jgi:hypothetical protein
MHIQATEIAYHPELAPGASPQVYRRASIETVAAPMAQRSAAATRAHEAWFAVKILNSLYTPGY